MLQNIIEDDDADDNDDNNCNTDEKTLVMTITQVPLFCSSWQTFALAASTSESKNYNYFGLQQKLIKIFIDYKYQKVHLVFYLD